MKRRKVVGLLALAGIALVAVGSARAVQLSVASSNLQSISESRCDDATLAARNITLNTGSSFDGVRIDPIDVACDALGITVIGFQSDGTQVFSVSGTASTGQNDIAVTTYDATLVAVVAVLVDGYGIPNTWTYVPQAITCAPYKKNGQPHPAKQCTVIAETYSSVSGTTPNQNQQVGFAVNSTAQSWRTSVDFTNANFEFPVFWVGQIGGTVQLAPGYTCPGGAISSITLAPVGGSSAGTIVVSESGTVAGATELCP